MEHVIEEYGVAVVMIIIASAILSGMQRVLYMI